jgi:hypothetical protein
MSSNPPTTGQELAAAPQAPGFAKASSELSLALGLTPRMMTDVLRAQCFRNVKADQVSDEQLAAFIVIANEMKVNPLLPGMMYAYPNPQGGGITPMLGPDGVFKKLFEHPDIDSWECVSFPAIEASLQPTHATMTIWRKGRDKPLTKTCLLSEWKIQSNPNWSTRTRHMLELRTIKQGARMIIHGLPFDEDERQIMGEMNVTGTGDDAAAAGAAAAATRAKAPKKEPKGAAAVVDTKQDVIPPTGKSSDGQKGGVVIDGEFTEVKRAENEAKANAAASEPDPAVQAKIDADLAAEAAKATAAANPPANTAPTAEAPKPRAFLQDGEQIETTFTVKASTPMWVTAGGKRQASIQAKVEGGFNGDVLHIGGGIEIKDGIAPQPCWEVGATTKATLLGKLNKTSNKVMVRVEKAELAPAEMSVD